MTAPLIYRTSATSTGAGRNGRTRTVDGMVDVPLAIPKEMGGAGGATNPEQLFAAGYAACFHSALQMIARGQQIELVDSAVTVEVGLIKLESGGFGLKVDIEAELPGVPREVADKLVATAHGVCPYSNAIRGNVDATIAVA
jgi:Ohr subfamily peroxiredoxin